MCFPEQETVYHLPSWVDVWALRGDVGLLNALSGCPTPTVPQTSALFPDGGGQVQEQNTAPATDNGIGAQWSGLGPSIPIQGEAQP